MSTEEKITRKPLTDPDEWEEWIKAIAEKQNRVATFEGSIEQVESACRRLLGPWPSRPANAPPPKQSPAWYAEEILLAIDSARRLLATGQAEYAAGEAVLIGALAAESEALHKWPPMRQWRDQQAARRRGGRASKHLRGLQAEVNRLATEHPKATVRELWNLIPESEPDDAPIGGFIVYRDGFKIVQAVEDETGRREKSISFRSFCRYVTRARSK